MTSGGSGNSGVELIDPPEARGAPISSQRSVAGILVVTTLIALCIQFQVAGFALAAGAGVSRSAGVALVALLALAPVLLGGRGGIANVAVLAGIAVALLACVFCTPNFWGPVLGISAAESFAQGLADSGAEYVSLLNGRSGGSAAVLLLGCLGLGLGLIGQPHIVDNIAATRSKNSVLLGTVLSVVWYVPVLVGMLIAGWGARILYSSIDPPDHVLLEIAARMMPPNLTVIPVAALVVIVTVAAGVQLMALGTAAHYLRAGDRSTPTVAGVRLYMLIATVLAALAATALTLAATRLYLFAWLITASVFGPLLLLRAFDVHIRAGMTAVALRVGLIVALLLFVFGRDNAELLASFVPFAAALLVAWLGRVRVPL
jgi:sodium/proline symporter